jgi:hypothetical protein
VHCAHGHLELQQEIHSSPGRSGTMELHVFHVV